MYFEGEASKNYLADFFHKRGEEVNNPQIRYFFSKNPETVIHSAL